MSGNPVCFSDFDDVHTHNLYAGRRAIVNLSVAGEIPVEGCFSVGIHPWDTKDVTSDDFERLCRLAADTRVVAIGETGLDNRCGADISVQEEVFVSHARLGERLGKPLIVHAVGTFPRLIALRRSLRPSQPWLVHGFRGKPELAAELLRHGFDLSFGERFNPASVAVVPEERLFAETDTSALPIAIIRQRLTQALSERTEL